MPKSPKFLFCRRLGKFNVNCINYTPNVNITIQYNTIFICHIQHLHMEKKNEEN